MTVFISLIDTFCPPVMVASCFDVRNDEIQASILGTVTGCCDGSSPTVSMNILGTFL